MQAWDKELAEYQYISENLSYAALAKRWGVEEGEVRRVGQENGWYQKRLAYLRSGRTAEEPVELLKRAALLLCRCAVRAARELNQDREDPPTPEPVPAPTGEMSADREKNPTGETAADREKNPAGGMGADREKNPAGGMGADREKIPTGETGADRGTNPGHGAAPSPEPKGRKTARKSGDTGGRSKGALAQPDLKSLHEAAVLVKDLAAVTQTLWGGSEETEGIIVRMEGIPDGYSQ